MNACKSEDALVKFITENRKRKNAGFVLSFSVFSGLGREARQA